MIGTIMADPRVKSAVLETFVPVLLNRFVDNRLAWEHQLYSYPTVIWLAPDGTILDRSIFGETAEDLLLDIEEVLLELEEWRASNG